MSKLLLIILLLVGTSSCTNSITKQSMQLCHDSYKKIPDSKALTKSLVKAQAWSNEIYGSDCYVCADIFAVEQDSFSLHITSPVEDMLINTSASMTFDMRGKVIEKAQYHSCYVRLKTKGN